MWGGTQYFLLSCMHTYFQNVIQWNLDKLKGGNKLHYWTQYPCADCLYHLQSLMMTWIQIWIQKPLFLGRIQFIWTWLGCTCHFWVRKLFPCCRCWCSMRWKDPGLSGTLPGVRILMAWFLVLYLNLRFKARDVKIEVKFLVGGFSGMIAPF